MEKTSSLAHLRELVSNKDSLIRWTGTSASGTFHVVVLSDEGKTSRYVSKRWEEGLPHTADYYYDEPLPEKTLTRTSKDIAPDGLDLADVWVVAIMQAVTSEERNRRWPAVFTTKGIRATYTHKGQASKGWDNQSKSFKYHQLFGIHDMYGSEGVEFEFPAKSTAKPDARIIDLGLTAQVQNADYDFDQIGLDAQEAREKLDTLSCGTFRGMRVPD